MRTAFTPTRKPYRFCSGVYNFEWVFEKLMYNPPEDELEGLLPEAWIEKQRRDSAVQSGDAA